LSLKGYGIFINEDLNQDQAKLMKEVQKVNEVIKEGKWAIIRNPKVIIRNKDQKEEPKSHY